VDTCRRPAHEPDIDVAKVVLRELARQPLETDHRPRRLRPQVGDERVERALSARVPVEANPPEDVERHQLGLARQHALHEGAERLRLGRAPDAPPSRPARIEGRHGRLLLDTTYGPLRGPCKPRHLGLCVAGPAQHLDLVPLHRVEHPFPRRPERGRALAAADLLADGDRPRTRSDRPEFPEWMRTEFSELTPYRKRIVVALAVRGSEDRRGVPRVEGAVTTRRIPHPVALVALRVEEKARVCRAPYEVELFVGGKPGDVERPSGAVCCRLQPAQLHVSWTPMTAGTKSGAVLALLLSSAAAPLDTAAPQIAKLDVRSFRPVEGPDSGPAVYYEVVDEDGVSMLRGSYRPGLDTVVMGIEIPEAVRGSVRRLKWRWRARAFPNGGNECRPGWGDSAASVNVAFKRGFRWYVLKYVWSPVARLGAVCDRKRTLLLVRDTIVLESAGSLETWRTEVVDVRRAFIEHFAGGDRRVEVPDLVGIGVMTDGDQTHSVSGADWADFEIQY
jgi:Protein of unknown function (DUF3047)